MKKVLAITCVLVLVLLVSSMAMATESNWRFLIRADNNTGQYASDSQLGMYPTSFDTYDAQDKGASFLSDPNGSQFAAWCTAIIPSRTEAFYADIKDQRTLSPTAPVKSWDLRVFALKDAAYSDIRLRFLSANSSTVLLMPPSFGGVAVEYYLKMVNNRGVEGAPADGTVWIVPRMSVVSTTNPFWSLVLPSGYGTAHDVIINPSNPANAAAEGYAMEFGLRPLAPVPEPSGVLALGTGIIGLAGFFARRRRA